MGVMRRYSHRDGSKEGGDTDTEMGVRRGRYRHRDGSKEREIQTQRWE